MTTNDDTCNDHCPQIKRFDEESKQWRKQARKTDLRLLVLFLALTIAFVFQSWRTEMNSDAITDGLHQACLTRLHTAEQFNANKEELIDLLVGSAAAQNLPPDRLANYEEKLRSGLLLPVEDCDPPIGD